MKEIKHTAIANLQPVSVIGLGMMGTAIAQTFLKEGHPTTVWNRTPGKAEALVMQGAKLANTVNEAIAASPIVVICVLDYGAVDDILEGAGEILAGRAIVNLTNGTPAQGRRTAAWVTERGADYLDGGIMAVPQMIGTSGALVLYSGSEKVFQAYQPMLKGLGAVNDLGEDPGLASLYDLVLLSAMYGMFGGFFQATAMIRSEQIQAEAFTELVVPWLQAMSASLPLMAQAVDAGEHRTNVSSLSINQTGFVNFIEVCQEQGISTELMTPIQGLITGSEKLSLVRKRKHLKKIPKA
ncbi:NAD(P)-dependent oxidoreductase [Paenibacillus methanolicus]|uniref:3-hydroxyisobutyrate dehydrogenase-like beta-hydroxyacid dehydrogenase n=1 Tax=Paenibacillus methanolicus TaxID=582686 RepID=A0A5S5C4L5_9BACL|nr:NAD(P)-binding domain-containing protein [Paenibacillus methanolicus]TYP73270.1 3-hydroxyisobutyrate dehydrogenase-like beta-hydroxyacid dehydrogenase [Paenibacillus methanolicus]